MLEEDKRHIGVSSCFNIRLHIVVIGYKSQGESILVLLEDVQKDDDKIVYSILIDSFYIKKKKIKVDITDEYLRKYKLANKLSTLIWTHPHLDHSKGLKHIFTKYTNRRSKIITAPYFYNTPDDIIKIKGKENIEVVNEIFDIKRIKEDDIYRPSVPDRRSIELDSLILVGEDRTKMNISLDSIAPNQSTLEEYKFKGIKDLNPNVVSISFILNIDDNYFLFGGDTPDEHFEIANSKSLEKCRFVKIPHHASKTSAILLDYLKEEVLETACTTKYSLGKSNLPDPMVISKYLELTENTFTTGDGLYNKYDYGIIEYEYILHRNENTEININLYGNAHQCTNSKN